MSPCQWHFVSVKGAGFKNSRMPYDRPLLEEFDKRLICYFPLGSLEFPTGIRDIHPIRI